MDSIPACELCCPVAVEEWRAGRDQRGSGGVMHRFRGGFVTEIPSNGGPRARGRRVTRSRSLSLGMDCPHPIPRAVLLDNPAQNSENLSVGH